MDSVITDNFNGMTKYCKQILVHNILYHYPEVNIIILNQAINTLIHNLDDMDIDNIVKISNDITHPDYWEKILELDLIRECILDFIFTIKMEYKAHNILPFINAFIHRKYGYYINSINNQ